MQIAFILQPLVDVARTGLHLFHGMGMSWGWSVVALTVLVRLLLLPLSYKQFRSSQRTSQRLEALLPQLRDIQAKYLTDRKRMNQETFDLYKRYEVNPAAPFGLMLLQ